jgi:uroporphyrin-III C-methyltransferase
MKTIHPKIVLVGAGPGDPELLTVKGLKALKEARVIVYDALVDPRLLQEAPQAQHVFVGKRKGIKALEQYEINVLLVQKSLVYGNVVRLKGGDSFVFGRGWEELEYAAQHGIDVEVIPGISSSISVPALAGIPVTHRTVSTGFHVITGTLSDGSFNTEIEQVASLNSTLVVLMGLNQLGNIVRAYRQAGKSDQAIAIISKGSWDDQSKLAGEIDTIESLARKHKPQAPAIIVVGDVVRLSDSLIRKQLEKALLN